MPPRPAPARDSLAAGSELKRVTLHTDGGCRGNPGPGAWAAVLRYGTHSREISGAVPRTTSNRMELQAAIEGFSRLSEPCEVECHTDSQYLRNGVTSWIHRWKKSGWRTADRQPVKNEDLWRQLDELIARHRVHWHWVRGHAGNRDNERCDELANEAMDRLRRSGSGKAGPVPAVVHDVRRERKPSPAHPSLAATPVTKGVSSPPVPGPASSATRPR